VATSACNVYHGFVRTAAGTITTFDTPGAGTLMETGTFASSIDESGDIAGFDLDETGVFHGFVRVANGTITTFDVPGAGTTAFTGTVPFSLDTTAGVTGV